MRKNECQAVVGKGFFRHAMKAGKNPPAGTVIGKALGKLDKGVGVVEVMVMMR